MHAQALPLHIYCVRSGIVSAGRVVITPLASIMSLWLFKEFTWTPESCLFHAVVAILMHNWLHGKDFCAASVTMETEAHHAHAVAVAATRCSRFTSRGSQHACCLLHLQFSSAHSYWFLGQCAVHSNTFLQRHGCTRFQPLVIGTVHQQQPLEASTVKY